MTCEACGAPLDGDHLHLCNDCAGSIDHLTTAKLEESFYNDLDQIRTLADQLQLPVDDILGNLGYDKIIRAAGEMIDRDGDLSALEWRFCSGFAHGQYWASLSLLDRELFATQAPGVFNVRLTNDLDKVLLFMVFPFALTMEALQLYEQRRRSPYSSV